MRDGRTAKANTGGTKCKGEEMKKSEERERYEKEDCMRLGNSI